MNFSRSSIGLHSLQGTFALLAKSPMCNPCARNELSPISQEGQSDKIKGIEVTKQNAELIFMLRLVAKISMYFQGSPICVGGSTQHERAMKSETRLVPRRESMNQLSNGCYGEF